MNLSDLKIDTSWTLFLDRDGVINFRIPNGYVMKWEEFRFIPGVIEALKILSGHFSKIIVVSNQQGVGKGLITGEEVDTIHSRMKDEISKEGGRIDRVYYSPFLEQENSIKRKPNVGMALLARKDLPAIIFKKSVMVGDSVSDMVFGKRLNMVNVFLSEDLIEIRKGHHLIDFVYPHLMAFAQALNVRD